MDLAITEEAWGNGDRSWTKSRLGYDQCRPGTLDLSTFNSAYYAANGYIPSGTPISLNASTGLYEPHGAPTNEVQTVTITGTPTGGTFTLASGGEETAAINYNAAASTVQTRLEAILGEGNVTVSGSAGGPYTVTYVGDLAAQDVAALTLGTNSLTGGTTPGVTIATGTAGGADANAGQTLDGLVFNDVKVTAGNENGKAAVAIFWMGIVDRAKLPFPIPASSEAQLPQIRFEGEA